MATKTAESTDTEPVCTEQNREKIEGFANALGFPWNPNGDGTGVFIQIPPRAGSEWRGALNLGLSVYFNTLYVSYTKDSGFESKSFFELQVLAGMINAELAYGAAFFEKQSLSPFIRCSFPGLIPGTKAMDRFVATMLEELEEEFLLFWMAANIVAWGKKRAEHALAEALKKTRELNFVTAGNA